MLDPVVVVKHSSSMTITEYMKSEGLTQRETARRLGMDEGQFSRYVNGRQRPGIPTAVAIEKATGGKVDVSSWMKVKAVVR